MSKKKKKFENPFFKIKLVIERCILILRVTYSLNYQFKKQCVSINKMVRIGLDGQTLLNWEKKVTHIFDKLRFLIRKNKIKIEVLFVFAR
jgi:hypothetical protein